MKKFGFMIASMMLCTVSAHAALPPFYQSTKEFRALLDSPSLSEIIGSGEPVVSIVRGDNKFIVKTNKHSLQVDIVYDHMSNPGPAKFHLAFHELEALE